MKRKTRNALFLVGLILGLLALNARVSYAEPSSAPSAGYALAWYTIESGGTMSASGGTYSLGGTIGQLDAGVQNSGNYLLVGGFWGTGSIQVSNTVNMYLPFIAK
jgi:hypothetical protein